FQVAVIENVNEKHLRKAVWLFPLYLFVINIFVLPIAFGGLLTYPGGVVDADTFVLALPMDHGQAGIALLVFVGGLSAATGMVIVETIALSTMICNDLVMPILLRLRFLDLEKRRDLTRLLLTIRRSSIIIVMLMGYIYFYFIGEFLPLVSIGLMSFAAVSQFAPAIIGGIFWREGSKRGAMYGMLAGFLVWAITLPIPSLASVDLLPQRIIEEGWFGYFWLKPYALFGLEGMGKIAHSMFWSLLFNTGLYVGLSLYSRRNSLEHTQASRFVDVFRYSDDKELSVTWRGTATPADLHSLLRRFMGKRRADHAFSQYAQQRQINIDKLPEADSDFVQFIEKLLAGAVGSSTARAMISTVVKEEHLSVEEVMNLLDETRQVIAYSRKLEQQSKELEAASAELKAANQRLQELDRLKDDFVSTVTHELRTPLTSVRAFSEILHDNADLDLSQRQHFLSIIIKESERLTRLINQLLDLQKIESETMDWHLSPLDIREIIQDAVNATSQLMKEKGVILTEVIPSQPVMVHGDRDRLIQVMLNLISNAIKFSDADNGKIDITLEVEDEQIRVDVRDNGIGIHKEDQELIFQKFRQVHHAESGRPGGSGLGLPITQRIIEYHQGEIWVKSKPNKGATFSFNLPLATSGDRELVEAFSE
ncbi:MAG TPA: ATP-binding protein, partial [Calditrichia bacterium]|nr:ATP-binding protein [Calditrichia bacterium]